MESDKKTKVLWSISLLLILSLILLQPMIHAQSSTEISRNGALVDKIRFNVITQDDQQVLALLDDEIDVIDDTLYPTFLETLQEAEDVQVTNTLRNGYGYLIINCAKYPFNITAFRRAFAFALDKEAISNEVWDGLSEPQDSVVPKNNPFSIEGQLDYSYYEANIEYGNYLLDQAGFEVSNTTGFRTTPNGNVFDVFIEILQSSSIAVEICETAVAALNSLHIDAYSGGSWWTNPNRLYFHGDYDVFFLGSTFTNFDVDWLAYEFWSGNINEPYQNFANFANATYDSWRSQLLHSTNYHDVYEAAIEMQKILVYEVPFLVCNQNYLLTAHRTDRFEGFINNVIGGTTNWWTKYLVHLKDSAGGPFGGTLRISNPLDIDTFNFMITSSQYARNVLELLYDSLLRLDPNGYDEPWLAESYFTETHADNPSVPSGHTRFTFDIVQNATWTDGQHLTAKDIAFTFNYYRESPGNPYGPGLSEMISAYAPTPYSLVVEFATESYWHLHSIAYEPIIPQHVFEVIGAENWSTWTPNPPVTPMVTSGPFNVSDYVAGEFIELTVNPNYFYSGSYLVPVSTIPDEISTSTEGTLPNNPLVPTESLLLLSIALTVPSLAVIVIVLSRWKKESMENP